MSYSFTPAPALPLQPAAHDALKSFDYPPVGAVTLSYPESAIREDRKDAQGKVPGFGQLHPRSQVGGGTAAQAGMCLPQYDMWCCEALCCC